MTEPEPPAPEHERFQDWDAAYLLGALAPADRHAYEDHIALCPVCAAAVGDLAGVPALLGALSAGQAMALLAEDRDPASAVAEASDAAADLVPALVRRARHTRRRRRWATGAVALAAAVALVVVTLVLPSALTSPSGPIVTTSLQQATASRTPLSADVTLTAQKWGTSVGMTCRWDAASSWAPAAGATGREEYGLWVVTNDGRAVRVATWSAGPGDVVRTTDSTDVPLSRIVRVELRSIDGRTVLLSADVHSDT